jgi:hypothetical protein
MTTYEYEGLICRVDMDVMGLADFNAFWWLETGGEALFIVSEE